MRLEGTLRSWNEERGFGFIHPRDGGEDVFVHISAFRTREVRPANNQRVTYEVEPGQHGKLRARDVEQILPEKELATVAEKPRRPDAYGWLAILLFVFLYAALTVQWGVSPIVGAIYVIVSVLTIAVYAMDKYSAVRGKSRVSEATLLLFGLFCGWPGAVVAQLSIRHKSRKPSFRRAFWATVFLNVAAFVYWHSPLR